MSLELQKILEAKENRARLRKHFYEDRKLSLSLSLNIAGYPKTNYKISLFFNIVLQELKQLLLANRIIIDEEFEKVDEAGNYFICSVNAYKKTSFDIKELTEKFEEQHELGRFIDVDIVNEGGKYISSNKLKLCYFCKEKAAIVCMREKNHSYKELRSYVLKQIENYLLKINKNNIISKLSELALKSILYEVSLTPKPGLVDFANSGSHTDMNYYTFLESSSAISQFFKKFAELGYLYRNNLSRALSEIRLIGLQTEAEMFKATKGVNTQKGIIFLIGISLFSASYVFSTEKGFNNLSFIKTVKSICSGLVNRELLNMTEYKTHGEICYKNFGLKGAGVRLEVEKGFPTVFNFALPVLEKYFISNNKKDIDFALKKTLLVIISKNNDSNILYRKGEHVLEKLKRLATDAFENFEFYKDLINFCKKENVSPGGSADLLAVSIFIKFVKEIKNEF